VPAIDKFRRHVTVMALVVDKLSCHRVAALAITDHAFFYQCARQDIISKYSFVIVAFKKLSF